MLKLFKKYGSQDKQDDIFGEKSAVMQSLHQRAQKQYFSLIPFMCRYALTRCLGLKFKFSSEKLANFLISIDPNQGRFIYNLVLSHQPKVAFEYGLSFGVSAIYVAQALSALNQGILYSTEIEPEKVKAATHHLEAFGLKDKVNILEGDISETINSINEPIDFVHMDGFPALNLPVIKSLEKKMSQYALIVTDDVHLFRREMKDYLDYLEANPSYSNTLVHISDGVMISIYCANPT